MRTRTGPKAPSGLGPRLLAAVAALSLAMTACQTTDSTETGAGVPDLPTEETASTGDGGAAESGEADRGNDDPPTDAEIEEAQLAFDQCMADAGFDLDAGSADGESIEDSDGPAAATFEVDGDPGEFDAALDECGEELEGVFGSYEPSPEEQAEMADQQAAFANCLADSGIEVDDAGDGGFVIGSESGSEADFEEQEKAMNDCAEKAFGESLIGSTESDGTEGNG